jgi:hypothetical protein
MGKYQNLSGQRFGRLVVVDRAPDHVKPDGNKQTAYFCLCDCGNRRVVLAYNLKNGHTTSCGCFGLENRKSSRSKHSETGTRLYRIWYHMKDRCNNPKDPRYVDYGGRGISVCEEWETSYEVFRNWAYENGYSETLTLDRENNDLGYSPDNCRWVTPKEQANNTRKNRIITFDSESHTLSEWGDLVGIKPITIAYRLKAGWSVESALFTPVRGDTIGSP